MKIKIKKKLIDLTKEEYTEYTKNRDNKICNSLDSCKKCPFRICTCTCAPGYRFSWVNNKDMFSDNFLDQEVEINVEMLTEKDKDLLKDYIAYLNENLNENNPQVTDVMKSKSYCNSYIDRLSFGLKDNPNRVVMWFDSDKMLINMPYNTVFQIKDLGLDEK